MSNKWRSGDHFFWTRDLHRHPHHPLVMCGMALPMSTCFCVALAFNTQTRSQQCEVEIRCCEFSATKGSKVHVNVHVPAERTQLRTNHRGTGSTVHGRARRQHLQWNK